MNALVTGGAGFIGSNIVGLLLEYGYDVTVLDNLSSGYIENIKEYLKGNYIRLIQEDIRNSKVAADACRGQDVVFHLAACVGRQKSLDDPVLDSSTNLIGTVNVLEGMRIHRVPRIVYSSSAAIFGEPITPTVGENHPQNADSPYGVSKLAAEKMILSYSELYEFTGICLRYFNIYGKNQRFDQYGNVIPIFAHCLRRREPLTVYGDGTQTRDFVNVKDIARANLMAALLQKKTAVYNLGSGCSITINKLAEMMQEIAGIQVGVHFKPERPADVKNCRASTDEAKRGLGFETEVNLEQGLYEYINWFLNSDEGE